MKSHYKTFLKITGFICILSFIVLVFLSYAQVMPIVKAGGLVQANGEDYEAQWDFDCNNSAILDITVSKINVYVGQSVDDQAHVRFIGKRVAAFNDEMPYLQASQEGNSLTIKEVRRETKHLIQVSFLEEGQIAGDLFIELPVLEYDSININNFRGTISIDGMETRNMRSSNSSGYTSINNVKVHNELIVSSFSGNIDLQNIFARDVQVNASSGVIVSDRISGDALEQNTFSGANTVRDIDLTDALRITTSSGAVRMDNTSSGSLYCTTYNGQVQGSKVQAAWDAFISTSSGSVKIAECAANSAEIRTFSGKVDLDRAKLAKLITDSSSGSATGTLLQHCDIQSDTFSGGITWTLPSDMEFQFKTETFSGRVSCEFPIVQNEDFESGVVGDGRNSVQCSTSSGDIIIKKGASAGIS